MPHTYTSLTTHIVFSTKERRELIDSALEKVLFPYFVGTLQELGGRLLQVNAAGDHVHLLAITPPAIAVSDLIGKIKGCSSRWIHESFPEQSRFGWQRGFGAFSVSPSQVGRVAAYIENQKEHHRGVSFRDEFVRLLRRHGISPDEKFLWT